jgi:hypothetical protein
MASRESISAIIELTDEKGSRVTGAAHRSGALSLRDEAVIFARSASLRHAGASRGGDNQRCAKRAADAIAVRSKRDCDPHASKHKRSPFKNLSSRVETEENG